jgi:hypothetical protein
MTTSGNRQFSWRAFVSTTVGLSFLGMCVTGIILFVVPPGRIANWTGWTIFGLTKQQWIGLHIWSSLIFTVAAIVHICLNWRCLMSYLKSRVSRSFALRAEWMAATLACAVITVGTLAGITPFSSLPAWSERIKQSWDDSGSRAPVPHAELLTLAQLDKQVDSVDLGEILENLKGRGIEAESPEAVVGDLARTYNMTPRQLYAIAVGAIETEEGKGGPGSGKYGQGGGPGHSGAQGAGRMTLKQYCAENGLDLHVAVEKLGKAGFKPSEEMTLRGIAEAAGIHPSEVRKLLE